MKKWTLEMKLYASFAVIILIMLGLGIFTIAKLKSVDDARSLRRELYSPASKLVNEIHVDAATLRVNIIGFKYSKEIKFLDETKVIFEGLRKNTERLNSLVEKRNSASFATGLVKEFENKISETENVILKLEASIKVLNQVDSSNRAMEVSAFNEIINHLEKTVLSDQKEAAELKVFLKVFLEVIRRLTQLRVNLEEMVESSSLENYSNVQEKWEKLQTSIKELDSLSVSIEDKKAMEGINDIYKRLRDSNSLLKSDLNLFIKSANNAFKKLDELNDISTRLAAESSDKEKQNAELIDNLLDEISFSIIFALALIVILASFLSAYLVKLITTPIRAGMITLASSTTQISATVNQLATSSAETASSIAETSTTVDEIRQTAELNSRKSQEVSDGAQEASDIAQNGLAATEFVINSMDSIKNQMKEISASILMLNEHNQMISEITETVNDLAEQSNLLAVNASIEAAKAGEEGKGFAVVAQEVRNLAEQSKQSTKQVRKILGEIQKATNKAVLVTEEGVKAVQQGKQQVESTSTVIKELTQTVNAAALAAAGISASSKQQLVGMEELASSMKIIKEAANQNRASMVQLKESSISLKGVSSSIKDLIGD